MKQRWRYMICEDWWESENGSVVAVDSDGFLMVLARVGADLDALLVKHG